MTREKIWHKIAPLLVIASLVTGAVTWPRAYAESEHAKGWNVVVSVSLDGDVVQMLRYNPDKGEPPEKLYASEAACKTVIDQDPRLAADVKELTDAMTAAAPAGHKLEIKLGCMAVDAEPETF
jgi:hypothetical protein